jgi:hypothetical protein
LGWLVEVPARLAQPDLPSSFGPFLMKLGVGLSAALISVPAVGWGGYAMLTLLGVVR